MFGNKKRLIDKQKDLIDGLNKEVGTLRNKLIDFISEVKSETIARVMEKIRSVIDNERNKRKELEIKLSCLTGYLSLLEDRLSEYKEKQKLIIDYLKVEQKTTPEKTELVKKKQ